MKLKNILFSFLAMAFLMTFASCEKPKKQPRCLASAKAAATQKAELV